MVRPLRVSATASTVRLCAFSPPDRSSSAAPQETSMTRLTLSRLARRLWPGLWPSAAAAAAGVGLLAGLHSYGLAEEASRRLPEAALQATEPTGGLRIATLAGGC